MPRFSVARGTRAAAAFRSECNKGVDGRQDPIWLFGIAMLLMGVRIADGPVEPQVGFPDCLCLVMAAPKRFLL
jgi:hypothetical protein